MKKGSITVFLALILSLSIMLVCTQLMSVKLAVSRAQIAGAMDIGLYSLFAQYDKDLLEEFELFFLDGSFGKEGLNMGKAYDVIKQYMEPVLEQNFMELKLEGGGFTGYQLATDDGGQAFYHQAVEAERLLLGEQGIQLLLSKTKQQQDRVEQQEQMRQGKDKEAILEQYDRELEEGKEAQLAQDEVREEVPDVPAVMPKENPIEVIRSIQKIGFLELVLENPGQVSEQTADVKTFVSERKCNKGMPMNQGEKEAGSADALLFQEYLLKQCGHYLNPGKGSLSYQVEYILFGGNSDMENLKKTVNRLLFLREGANLIHLYGDKGKYSQASALAAGIAASLLLPVAEPVICLAILSCWAFGESILDVRRLMGGNKVALVKGSEDWQLSLENLPRLLEHLDDTREGQNKGLGYQDYLRLLLLLTSQENKTARGMNMVEASIRGLEGRKAFRLDCCISAVEAVADVKAGKQKTYCVSQNYTYGQT